MVQQCTLKITGNNPVTSCWIGDEDLQFIDGRIVQEINLEDVFPELSLTTFSEKYDHGREASAFNARGRFIELFPIEKLKFLKVADYVIGTQRDTFCAMAEAKTRNWANIQGASAIKFKLYFGKRKPETENKYRFTKQFSNEHDAFHYIKETLLELVKLAQEDALDFEAIDAVDISQMFKAKILSLYFPDRFANICSGDDLRLIAEKLFLPDGLPLSRYQNLLVQLKNSNKITRQWSTPKFMNFIYRTYVRGSEVSDKFEIRKPKKQSPRKVNFEDISAQRSKIGAKAELYAIDWEKKRLVGEGLAHLITKIQDFRDRPSYGYDYSSYSKDGTERYIEVKSVGKLKGEDSYRFFLSENELFVSKDELKGASYYFYLVFFDSNGMPCSVKAIESAKLYKDVELHPVNYQVQFDVDKLD